MYQNKINFKIVCTRNCKINNFRNRTYVMSDYESRQGWCYNSCQCCTNIGYSKEYTGKGWCDVEMINSKSTQAQSVEPHP